MEVTSFMCLSPGTMLHLLVKLENIGHGWFPVSNSLAELVPQVLDGVPGLATSSDMEDERCCLVVPYADR